MAIFIKNAVIATMDKEAPKANAAIVNGKYFAFVGTEEGAKAYMAEHEDNYEVLDCGGQLLTPGFNDSHMHWLHYVKTKIHVDLVGCKSIKEMQDRMKKAYETFDKSSGLWFIGEGWNHDFFEEKRYPTKEELDEITTEIPIMIQRTCGHVGVISSKALEEFAPYMEKGDGLTYSKYAEKDANGELTGVIKENLFDYFKTIMPAPTYQKLVELSIEHQKDAFEVGLTTVQSDDYNYTPEGTLYPLMKYFVEKSESGEFKLRLSEQALHFHPELLEEHLNGGLDHTFGNDMVKIACTKLLADGALGARTALMRKDYDDDPGNRGIATISQEDMDKYVYISHKNNTPVAVHCIGDGAIEMTLNSIEKAQKAMPYLKPRHGIVHCQVTDKALIRRFKELGVVAFIQPIFIDYDMDIIYQRVGKEMADQSYAWKDYYDMDICAPFGTDCPVEGFNPLTGIYCAVTRKGYRGNGPYLPEQALTVDESIYGYTAAGAYAESMEDVKGKIMAGMLADFVTLDKNLYEIDPEEILTTKVTRTYIGGECVFERK